MATSSIIEAADHAARNWRYASTRRIRRGDDGHRAMLARLLLDTFNPYKPAVIDWPQLEPEARQRLISLPIWDIAVQTEGRARLRILSYARTVPDPLLREAFELMGFEEGRHKEVLSHLVAAYGIELEPEPEYLEPTDPEWGVWSPAIPNASTASSRSACSSWPAGPAFSPGAGGNLRAGDSGRRPAYPVLRQLGGLAQAHHAAVAPPLVLPEDAGGLGIPDPRADRAGPRCESGRKEDANFTVRAPARSAARYDTAELMDLCLAENDRRLAGYDLA